MTIDTLSRERCVSVGARDKTCRLFKVVEEKQLIFRGDAKVVKRDDLSFKENSIDVVEMIDEDNFLSGGDSGYDILFYIIFYIYYGSKIFIQNFV